MNIAAFVSIIVSSAGLLSIGVAIVLVWGGKCKGINNRALSSVSGICGGFCNRFRDSLGCSAGY